MAALIMLFVSLLTVYMYVVHVCTCRPMYVAFGVSTMTKFELLLPMLAQC